MYIDPVKLKSKSQLIKDYRAHNEEILHYFDYSPFDNLIERVKDVQAREFDRESLTNVLYTINEEWHAPDSTFRNIERLKDTNSVVVIGGQQAGLLTGPFYTINKIISIIQFARQQESKLQIPVVPVFWIAGEDHDYDEINHIFLSDLPRMKKHKIDQHITDKQSISQVSIDKESADLWLKDIFKQLSETEYTKDLYETIQACLNQSETYVDFFAHLIFKLFQDEGLVLIDSGHPDVRRLESSFFMEFIEKQPMIASNVYASFQQIKQLGYSVSLDVDINDAHIFYHNEKERILLERDQNQNWIGKNNEVMLTTEALLKIAEETPELLSNNVVTRPLMQELLFPSLAFIGGDGEISYWSVLKGAFHAMGIKMPPVLPRLSFSYVDRSLKKRMEKRSISCSNAINDGVEHLKMNWLASHNQPPINVMVEQMKHSIDQLHQPLREVAREIRTDLGELAEKNLGYLYRDIDYLQDKIMKVLEEKYANDLKDFELIHHALHPFGALQERTWNPIEWINEHGTTFINDLLKENCSFEEDHYVVYL